MPRDHKESGDVLSHVASHVTSVMSTFVLFFFFNQVKGCEHGGHQSKHLVEGVSDGQWCVADDTFSVQDLELESRASRQPCSCLQRFRKSPPSMMLVISLNKSRSEVPCQSPTSSSEGLPHGVCLSPSFTFKENTSIIFKC